MGDEPCENGEGHEQQPRDYQRCKLCMCVYVCMCVCMYICVYMCSPGRMVRASNHSPAAASAVRCTCMYACMYVCMYVYLHICTHTCVCIRTHMVYTHTYIYVYMYTHTHTCGVCVCVCLCVCVCVCMCTHTHTTNTQTHKRTLHPGSQHRPLQPLQEDGKRAVHHSFSVCRYVPLDLELLAQHGRGSGNGGGQVCHILKSPLYSDCI